MTKPRQIEQAISALVLVAIAILAWFPLIVQSQGRPYTAWMLVPMSLAMVLFALALVYDVAERMLGPGRGIYAVAVFCTVPAVGLAACDPAAMQLAAFLVFNAAAVFLASRARGEERPFFLGMLALLLLVAGAFFGFPAAAMVFAFAIVLAVGEISKRPARVLLGMCLLLLYVVSANIRFLIDLPLPHFTLGRSAFTLTSVLSLLPWTLWIIPALLRFRSRSSAEHRWRTAAALFALVAPPFAVLFGDNVTAVSVAFAPALALLATHLLHEDLAAGRAARNIPAVTLPALLTALALLTVAFFSVIGVLAKPVMGATHIAAGVILAVALAWAAFSRLHRWAFFLLAIAGVYFGLLVTQREPLFPSVETAAAPVPLSFFLLILAASLAAAVTATLVKRKLFSGEVKEPDEARLFAADSFRSFAGSEPRPVSLADLHAPFSFAVFGDVAGAESLFATRRGGFFMFRALARTLNESSPTFAVSLGDLAREASPFAYRRLRRLLRKISAPLTVTPGNHDVFLGDTYDAAHFHRLFGADNGAFDAGPVRFVLLNNAFGFVSEAQFEWLDRVLSEGRPFTVVFCHKPVFEQRSDVFYAMETREHAQRLHELFCARGVTAVFSGHIHSLLHERRDGVTYIISGGGGSKLTSADDRYHYLLVAVRAQEIVVRALPLGWKRLPGVSPLLELHFAPRP
ncbi:MAG: metallophosphoesterase [bacterium]|nr:metallophosphoesterase [bacterium]